MSIVRFGNRLSNRLSRGLRRLHMDAAGDLVQKILIVDAIALPILLILLFFRNDIAKWFKEEKGKVQEQRNSMPGY